MQPEERDAVYLWDMLQAAKEVKDMTAGHNLENFLGTVFYCAPPSAEWKSSAKPRGCIHKFCRSASRSGMAASYRHTFDCRRSTF